MLPDSAPATYWPVTLAHPLLLASVGLAAAALLAWVLWQLLARLERSEAERRRATTELNRRLSELFSLQELSYVLSDSLQLDRIVDQVVRFAVRFCDAQGALLALAGHAPAEGLRVAGAEGSLADLKGAPVADDDVGLIARSVGKEQIEVARPAEGTVALVGDVAVGMGVAVPLRAHGLVVGSLIAVDPLGGEFATEDLRLLTTVATHAAVAIANARLFEMVQRGKQEWETAFDALREGIAVVDEEGRVLRANRALAGLLHEAIPRLVGESLSQALFGPERVVADLLVDAQRGMPSRAFVARSTVLARTLRLTAAPITRAGAVHAVVVLVEDVTEQKALEASLIQSEKLATVGQLVSGVAHELNNPLTSITGLSEFLLEQQNLSTKDLGHLRVIHEQAERAGRIVRNLLTFARQGPGDRAAVDLNDVVQRTLMLMAHDLRLREVEIRRTLAPTLPPVLGDRHALQQVVLNLITNAAQAVADVPAGRPRLITVTTWADGHVHLRVADTGGGIPDTIRHQLFTPFFTTKAPGQGTGLGLSICFSIVDAHGGQIAVEHPPAGAALRLDFPPAPAEASASAATAESAQPQLLAGAHRTILLVDEDPAVRLTVQALFDREGHTVEIARAPKHALELTARREWDLVIVDARGTRPGRLFVEDLLEARPGLKGRLLVVTGDVRPATEEVLKRLGLAYVRKPFNLRALRSEVVRVWAAGAVS